MLCETQCERVNGKWRRGLDHSHSTRRIRSTSASSVRRQSSSSYTTERNFAPLPIEWAPTTSTKLKSPATFNSKVSMFYENYHHNRALTSNPPMWLALANILIFPLLPVRLRSLHFLVSYYYLSSTPRLFSFYPLTTVVSFDHRISLLRCECCFGWCIYILVLCLRLSGPFYMFFLMHLENPKLYSDISHSSYPAVLLSLQTLRFDNE